MKNTDDGSSASLSWITLLTSSGTLICCALPIVLVTLGFGATVAALTQALPFLVFLSVHKAWVFSLSAIMLVVSAGLIYRSKRACPTDPQLAVFCDQARGWNVRLFWLSLIIWCIGFFAAFLALPLRVALDR